MNRLITTSLLCSIMALTGLKTMAASSQATLTLNATVNLEVSGSAGTVDNAALAAVLTGTGAGGFLLATINEKCNKNSGYTVNIASANLGTGKLAGSVAGTEIPYTLNYGGSGITLSSGQVTLTRTTKTGGQGDDYDLKIIIAN